jgi:hypothetical protein
MKTPITYLFLSIVTLCLGANLFAQTVNHCLSVAPDNIDRSKTVAHDCGKWKRLTLIDISLCIPKEFEVKNAPSMEGGRVQFQNSELRFSIDYSLDSWRPTVERRYASYNEEVFVKDSVRYWTWNFDGRDGWKYVSGMNIWEEKHQKYVAGIFLFSNSADSKELAQNIFRTACYEPKPQQ